MLSSKGSNGGIRPWLDFARTVVCAAVGSNGGSRIEVQERGENRWKEEA